MGIFRRRKDEPAAIMEAEPECPHVALLPHWDDPNDMGHEDRASSFRCQACSQVFTPAEARELRATEAERIRGTN
jgi:hypothetical protein